MQNTHNDTRTAKMKAIQAPSLAATPIDAPIAATAIRNWRIVNRIASSYCRQNGAAKEAMRLALSSLQQIGPPDGPPSVHLLSPRRAPCYRWGLSRMLVNRWRPSGRQMRQKRLSRVKYLPLFMQNVISLVL